MEDCNNIVSLYVDPDEEIAQQETPDSCSKLENKPVAELCKHFVLKCQEIIEALW